LPLRTSFSVLMCLCLPCRDSRYHSVGNLILARQQYLLMFVYYLNLVSCWSCMQ
jgi:hypothetical protein